MDDWKGMLHFFEKLSLANPTQSRTVSVMSSWGTSLLGTEISKFGTDVNVGTNGKKKGRVESRVLSKTCGWCSLDNLLECPESADH